MRDGRRDRAHARRRQGQGVALALSALALVAVGALLLWLDLGSHVVPPHSHHSRRATRRDARNSRQAHKSENRDEKRSDRHKPDASKSADEMWASSCKLGDWMKLGKCKHGFSTPGCSEGYHTWFEAGCLCDYSAYPWGFLPKDITPVGFTWALMKTNISYAQIASQSGCMEQLDDCNAPREGDVRLDAYGHGTLELFTSRRWRRVVGEVDNETAYAQCTRLGARPRRACARAALRGAHRARARRAQPARHAITERASPRRRPPRAARAGFTQGGLADSADIVTFDSQSMVLVNAPCEAGNALDSCVSRARHHSGRAKLLRLACTHDGPAGCFIARNGRRECVVGKRTYNRTSALPASAPSFACGTSGSGFLAKPPLIEQKPPQAEEGGMDDAACHSLFENVLARCGTADQSSSRWPSRQMCSDGCHDTILQAILAEACHVTVVDSTWGATFGGAIKSHAEILYNQCGRDLWQTAAVSVSLYEGCMDLLIDMWKKCQEDSQKHLCSDSCAERVNDAMRAESCYDMHYFRRDSKTFRGHVEIMRELRIRVCQQPRGWS